MTDVLPAGLQPSSTRGSARGRQVQWPRDDLGESTGKLARCVEIDQSNGVRIGRVRAKSDQFRNSIVEMLTQFFDDLRLALRFQPERGKSFEQFTSPH